MLLFWCLSSCYSLFLIRSIYRSLLCSPCACTDTAGCRCTLAFVFKLGTLFKEYGAWIVKGNELAGPSTPHVLCPNVLLLENALTWRCRDHSPTLLSQPLFSHCCSRRPSRSSTQVSQRCLDVKATEVPSKGQLKILVSVLRQ